MINIRLMVAVMCFALSSCFGGAWNISETARPAMTKQYLNYLNDSQERARVDSRWLETVAQFERAGWEKPVHPWGDKSLNSKGINKVRDHQYSSQ